MFTSLTPNPTRRYVISAHPYLFDGLFRALRWCGPGEVTLEEIYGGVNEAQAVVVADHQAYLALKTVGFTVDEVEQDTLQKDGEDRRQPLST